VCVVCVHRLTPEFRQRGTNPLKGRGNSREDGREVRDRAAVISVGQPQQPAAFNALQK
jgi:hypothetical protein